MRRLPPWLLWLIAGPVVGAAVVGAVAPFAFFATEFIHSGVDRGDVEMAPWAALVLAFWALFAGFGAAVICAVVTGVVDRLTGGAKRWVYVAVPVVATLAIATPISAMFVDTGYGDVTVFEVAATVAVVVLGPVLICAVVAALVGALIWQSSPGARQDEFIA